MAAIDDAHGYVDEIWGPGRTLKQRAVAVFRLFDLLRDTLNQRMDSLSAATWTLADYVVVTLAEVTELAQSWKDAE